MRHVKKVFAGMITCLLLVIACVAAEAGEKPVVYMAPDVCTVKAAYNNIPIDNQMKESIKVAAVRKLSEMERAGKLPFRMASLYSANFRNDYGIDNDVFVIPTVMLNSAVDVSLTNYSKVTYYQSRIICGVSLIFCAREESGEDSDTVGVTYRILGMVPMLEFETLGTNTAPGGPRTQPISMAEKQRYFTQLASKAINGQMEITGGNNIGKNMKDIKYSLAQETYQVTDVNLNGSAALEFANRDEAEMIKNLVAYAYTSAYQKQTKRIVLPPAVSDKRLANEIVDALHINSQDAAIGKVNLEAVVPYRGIRLNIANASKREGKIDPKNPRRDYRQYKVAVGKAVAEKGEKTMMEQQSGLMVMMPDQLGKVDSDDKGIYSSMLMRLAMELGSQKI